MRSHAFKGKRMKRGLKAIVAVCVLTLSTQTFAATQCAADAVGQAKKLLNFHSDGDSRAEVSTDATELPSIINPINKKQKFKVFEVFGYVYKGTYRMRLIYYPLGDASVLMGQEILELANL